MVKGIKEHIICRTYPVDSTEGSISAAFYPADEQLAAIAKLRTFRFPRDDVQARRKGALTDRLNTW